MVTDLLASVKLLFRFLALEWVTTKVFSNLARHVFSSGRRQLCEAGEVMFPLTQQLTGHGCFNRFLHRIGRASSLGCSHWGPPGLNSEEEKSAYYAVIYCQAFKSAQEAFVQRIDDLHPSDLVTRMLEAPTMWDSVFHFTEDVTSAKEEAKRDTKQDEGVAPSYRWRARRVALDRL